MHFISRIARGLDALKHIRLQHLFVLFFSLIAVSFAVKAQDATIVGTVTRGSRSTIWMSSTADLSFVAFSPEVDRRWKSTNDLISSGEAPGMKNEQKARMKTECSSPQPLRNIVWKARASSAYCGKPLRFLPWA